MNNGLDGVVVAETRLSEVDGLAGELTIAGCRLLDFATLDFEQAAESLLGRPAHLRKASLEAYERLRDYRLLLSLRPPIDALRLGLSLLPSESSPSLIIAAIPVILSAAKRGEALGPPPQPSQGHVSDFLTMFHGSPSSARDGHALSRYLVTVSEHGMNASTFTARVIASTEAPLLDAVIGALGALKGALHGGAPGPVLDLLDEMAGCSDIEKALSDKVRRGQRLMGFGHRIYRTRDPRADVLRQAVALLEGSPRLRLAETVERLALTTLRTAKPDRPLETNVEFYTAVLLERLGFERDSFTALFATGRVLGWIAHYQEQRRTGRLIRPASTYVGARPPLETSGEAS